MDVKFCLLLDLLMLVFPFVWAKIMNVKAHEVMKFVFFFIATYSDYSIN